MVGENDYYWQTGDNGVWSDGGKGWTVVRWACENYGPDDHPNIQCKPEWESGVFHKGNIYFKRFNNSVYPKRYDASIGKNARGEWPTGYNVDIDNSSHGGNYTFKPADGRYAKIIGVTDSLHPRNPVYIQIHGSTSANRYTATFENVDFDGEFSSFAVLDYDSVVFRGGSVNIAGNSIKLSDHAQFSWDGRPNGAGAYPTLKADGIIGDSNAVLSLNLPDGARDLTATLAGIGGSTTSGLFTVHLSGGSRNYSAIPYISYANVFVDAGKITANQRPNNISLSIAQGAELTAPGMTLKGLRLDGLLSTGGALSTPTLSGGGNISLTGNLTISGGKDAGKGVSSFDGFTGNFNLNNHTLTVSDLWSFGQAQGINGGGALNITTLSGGRNVISPNFSAGTGQQLVLKASGQPLTLAASGATGGYLFKDGEGELILSGGTYNYQGEIGVLGGRLTLTNGVGLSTSKLNLYSDIAHPGGGGTLSVTGAATLNGSLSTTDNSRLILNGGNLNVTGNVTLNKTSTFDYRGGLLTVGGMLDLGDSTFVADLPHPGVFVVADYGSLRDLYGFSNLGGLTPDELRKAVTINGQQTAGPIDFQLDNDKRIVLAAAGNYSVLYRTSSYNDIWGDRYSFNNWQDLNKVSRNWQNPHSHVAVFGAAGATPGIVKVYGGVTANMLQFLDAGWQITASGQTITDGLTLHPFVDDPASPYYFAVLNSQADPAGTPLPLYDAPRLELPLLVSHSSAPLWKTGGGDLVLAGMESSSSLFKEPPLNVIIKDGRLILAHENATGAGSVNDGQIISIDQGAGLVLSFLNTGQQLFSGIKGAGRLEAWEDAILTQASPDFTGPVLVNDNTTLTLRDRQAAGDAPGGEAVSIGSGATVELAYTDGDKALPRVLSGEGGVAITNTVRLAGGNSYTGGTRVGDNAALLLEGSGGGQAFTAAGSGGITLGASAELKLLSGGILQNELVGGAGSQLTLDAHAYRLEDNNIRADGRDFAGAVSIAKGGALTLSAGTSVTPLFSITGAGGLLLNGSTFSGLRTSDFEGRTVIENHTTLELAGNNYGKNSATAITLLGADSLLRLNMAGTFTNQLSGAGTVKLGSGTYSLTGNNLVFAGVIDVNSNRLDIAAQSDVGDARLDLGGGRLDFTTGLTLNNSIRLYSGGGTLNNGLDILLRGHISDGDSARGDFTKTGSGILTLTHSDSDYSGNTDVREGTLRLEDGGLTGGGSVMVRKGATLSGYGRVTGETTVAPYGTLSADGHFIFENTLTLSTQSNLTFNHGGWLDVSGQPFLEVGNIKTTINLDSLGVQVLARYGSTNLNGGIVDEAHYTVNYNGNDITDPNYRSNYRMVLENFKAEKEILLITLPTGQKVEFWNSDNGGLWNTDNARSWNSKYDASGLRETWASDSVLGAGSRIAVFGTSSVIPGEVRVEGAVAASGLFFLKSGYAVTGGTIGLLDLDPLDIGNSYAVISGQEGDVRLDATLTDDGRGVGLHKSGAGTITLNAANSYGDTLVSAGTLALGNVNAAGRNPATITVEDGATLRLSYDNPATGLPQTVTGDGLLEISDNVLLDKANTHSGGTSIAAGELHLAHKDALGTGTLFFRNGLLSLADGLDVGNNVDLEGIINLVSIAGGEAATLSGNMTGSGGLDKIGAGTLIVTGDNTFTGNLRLDQGKLVAGSDTALGQGTVRMANGAILGFSGLGLRTLQNEFNLNGTALFEATGTLAGDIYGSGDLAKIGGGTLTLGGANTYTGLTDVREGTLALAAGGRISDRLTLHDGATFDTGGNDVRLAELNAHWQASYKGDLHTAGGVMKFYLPAHVAPGKDAILNVDGQAEIGGSWVALDLGGRDRMDLRPGHVLHLMQTTQGIDGMPANNVATGRLGITRAYTANLWTDPQDDPHDLYAGVTHLGASRESKALSEGFLAGLARVNQGADLVAGSGLGEAVSASRRAAETEPGPAAFGSISGGWSRYNTGSHVDMGSLSLMTGVSAGLAGDAVPGLLTIGAFFEYGNGSYDAYNSFSNAADIHGKGNTYYLGGGILGHMDFTGAGPGNFYTEGSFRAGGLHNDYNSSDHDSAGLRAGYDSSSAYYGFHLGTGYAWNIYEKTSLDLYGKYFQTRLKGDSVRLPNGDPVEFKDADSSRLRLGGRLSYAVKEKVSPYIGAAYEHEFDGRARATTYGYSIDVPSLRGGTGIGELGLTWKPSQDLPLSLDLGLSGYAGQREGVTGSLQLKFEF